MFGRGRGKDDVFLACAAAQIGMHHAALDGTGPHDRDFDDKIVEIFGLQPRQHAHLRAAFDLEHADGIGLAQHVVDLRIFAAHIEIERLFLHAPG